MVDRDVWVQGRIALPEGSEVLGVVTEVRSTKSRIGGRAKLAVRFTEIRPLEGDAAPIHARYEETGRKQTTRDAVTIGGATVGGAVLGAILDEDERSRGGAIGAVVGAAAGTAAAMTHNKEIVLARGSLFTLWLEDEATYTIASRS